MRDRRGDAGSLRLYNFHNKLWLVVATEWVGGRMGVNCDEKADPAAASSLLSRE